ncbi:MAG: formylglycine-generating enzyme family protein [Acidobacteria bacterium]|nr:MAG: formylglycine-generating enzyme family protein [Acidobacteriota bacterium]
MRPFLDELATKTGILGPHDGRDADWRFWHRTFREALASEQLAATWRGGQGKKEVLAHAASIAGDESRWAEPYALLAGRVADPDALVKALVAANRELGLRALATAQGLKEKTIREVLALTGRWEERAEVFLRIPGLLGDADRALRLLLRLAHATRDGNDLFFLHQAIGRVATASPDHAPQAEQAQAKLYDHIPKPDPALFESFYAPHAKKRVPLWVEARAGSFVMGGGGYNVERPKHQVRFDKHFRIGAVPVTNHQYLAFDPGHRVEHWEGVSEEKLRDHPVVNVTWYAAVAFCRWLRAALPEAEGARLPTEEEWEYACRAGTTTEYGSGDEESDLKKVGWYNINSGDRTHRVGELEANQWGLYDAHGNVWEWTGSVWTNDYSAKKAGVARDPSKTPEVEPEPEASRPSEPEGDSAESAGAGRPAGLPRGALRVFRGGSFEVDAVLARSAFRLRDDPRSPWRDRGFRVVLPPPEHR